MIVISVPNKLKLYIKSSAYATCYLSSLHHATLVTIWGWSGGAKVLGKLPVPGRPTIWIKVGKGPTALAVGAVGGCLDIFTLIYPFLSSAARYRLKYRLKGPLSPKQPTNQPSDHLHRKWLFIWLPLVITTWSIA